MNTIMPVNTELTTNPSTDNTDIRNLSNKDKAKKILLDQPNDDLGICKWIFVPGTDIKFEGTDLTFSGEAYENYGVLVRHLGYVSYLQTFIDDSKQFPYYTISQEVKDEIKNIISECVPLTGKEDIKYQIIEYLFPNGEVKKITAFSVNYISEKILNVLASFDQDVTIQGVTLDKNTLLLLDVIAKYGEIYPDRHNALEKFLCDKAIEYAIIKDEQKYIDKLTLLMEEFEKNILNQIQLPFKQKKVQLRIRTMLMRHNTKEITSYSFFFI